MPRGQASVLQTLRTPQIPQMARISTAEAARRMGCSEATVIRRAQQLGGEQRWGEKYCEWTFDGDRVDGHAAWLERMRELEGED